MNHEHGEPSAMTTEEQHQLGHAALNVDYAGVHDEERKKEMALPTRVVGMMDFGAGSIDGASSTREQFAAALEFLATEGLTSINEINKKREALGKERISSIFEIPGSCMDGRLNAQTLSGEKVEIARPKVVGGPTLYLNNVLSIAGVFQDGSMLSNFAKVAAMFPHAAGMHEACGMAAQGSRPVLEKYHDKFDEIAEALKELTQGGLIPTLGQTDAIKRGLDSTIQKIEREQDNYNEEAMINIVRQINGDQAILQYEIDHEHPQHSHEEDGLAYLFSSDDLVMVKDAVVQNAAIPDMFYHNAGYGKKLIKVSVGVAHKEQLELAQIIGMGLPTAANATLGKNQWLGGIGDYNQMSKHFLVA